ncbi:MAG: tRNA (adenine-N1)-methyltransferase [Thermodesulfobacteriota bacterium]
MSDKSLLRPGEPALLIDERDRQYLVTVPGPDDPVVRVRGEALTPAVFAQAHDGGVISDPLRRRYLVLRPTLEQVVMNMPRQAQVIYPKDLGLILTWGDVAPGQSVVEVGCGHGALTMALLRALGPEGRLTSYDLRRDHLNRTRKNIAAYLGPEALERWTPVWRDPTQEGIDEREVDRLFSDMPEPWGLVSAAAACLRPGAIWMAYVPTVPQLAEQVNALNRSPDFGLSVAFEALQRFWHVRPPSVRPRHGMSAHTGFIISGRRRWRPAAEPGPEATQPEDAGPGAGLPDEPGM